MSAAAAAAKSLQSWPTLCDPIDGSPPGSSVLGILQARTLEWVAISFSNAWKWKVKVKSQSCPTLSDPMDCSLPGSSVHGIFQARVLEWGAIAFSVINVYPLQLIGIPLKSLMMYSLPLHLLFFFFFCSFKSWRIQVLYPVRFSYVDFPDCFFMEFTHSTVSVNFLWELHLKTRIIPPPKSFH